jgi:imidazolonepropionase-like amidohydrolase
MQTRNTAFFIFSFLLSTSLWGQNPAPGRLSNKPLLIVNAEIHDGQGNRIPKGYVRVEGKKITATGQWDPATFTPPNPAETEILDANGMHLYPGFILLNTPLGLSEIDAVRATNDFNESGDDNPGARALVAYNTDSDIIPTLRLNGVLTAQISPRGNRIRGKSSVVQLDAWNWEDAVIKEDDGLHLSWPSRYQSTGWWAEPGVVERKKEYQNEREVISQWFTDARIYKEKPSPTYNSHLAGLATVLSGETTLYIHAKFASDIVTALKFVQSQKLKKVVLVTGSQVLQVLPLVKSMGIPVVVTRVHSLPVRPEDPVHLPMETPVRLIQEGILCALDYSGDMEIMGARNLGFLAGTCMGYGLTEDQALKLISSNPAKILGLENQTGSIKPGLEATFFISNGPALNMTTQDLRHAWIQGRKISLESKQTHLYSKYKTMLEKGRD